MVSSAFETHRVDLNSAINSAVQRHFEGLGIKYDRAEFEEHTSENMPQVACDMLMYGAGIFVG